MNIKELLEWHEHQAKECRKEGQENEREFHELASELLKDVFYEQNYIFWSYKLFDLAVDNWTDEEKETLHNALEMAVDTTCRQIQEEVQKDLFG